MVLPEFDIIIGVATDYMHNVLLGVVKRLIGIWLGDLKIVESNFKAISKQNQIQLNNRLVSLKPYSRITQKPRSYIQIHVILLLALRNKWYIR